MSEATLDSALRDKVYGHAQMRAMSRIRPGWWIRSYDGDNEEWNRVSVKMDLRNVITGQEVVQLICKGGVEVADFRDALVLSCTAAEAKRAGLRRSDG